MRISSQTPQVGEMTAEQRKLWQSCQQLEQTFLEIMLKQMQSSSAIGGALQRSMQRDIYEDMQRQSLAEQMAKSGDVGLAAMLYRQLNNRLPERRTGAVPSAFGPEPQTY